MDFDFTIGGTTKIGERGQIVIPASIRREMKLKTGDKLVAFCRAGGMIGLLKASEIDSILAKVTAHMSGGLASMKKLQREIKNKKK